MSARIKFLRLLGAAMVTLVVVPWLSTSIATAADAPPSGDPRAVSHDGNATTCSQAGLAGIDITTHVTSTNDGTFIDISAVGAGYTVTGIVVKGGSGYNVYQPGQNGLGAARPWNDLHSPLVGANDQNVPAISHWFVCGTTPATPTGEESTPSGEESTPSGEESTPSGEESTPSGEESTPSGEESTPSGEESTATTTTGGVGVLPTKIGNTDTDVLGTKTGALAATGLDLPLPAVLGLCLGLLLAGGALMVAPARMATERKRRH